MPLSVALRASLAIETSCSDLVTSALISWMVLKQSKRVDGNEVRGGEHGRWNY